MISSVTKICNVIKGKILHAVDPDVTSEMIVMVGAMSAEGFTKRLHKYPASQLLVVSGDRPTIQLLSARARSARVSGDRRIRTISRFASTSEIEQRNGDRLPI